MAAGLQGHIAARPTRLATRRAQSQDLGVRLTGSAMPALADDGAVFDQHAADARVRVGGIEPEAPEGEGAGHMPVIVCAPHGAIY